MPCLYTFEHPDTGEIKDVAQAMSDEHIYVDDKGVKWNRVFSNPRTSIDTKIDPFSKKDFLKRTNKTCTVGDMMDLSSEMSERRAGKAGKDPIKQKAFDKYNKEVGKPHPLDRPSKIETERFTIDLE
jgi:hypothetical protein